MLQSLLNMWRGEKSWNLAEFGADVQVMKGCWRMFQNSF